MGVAIWKISIGGSVPLKNKSKFAAQREGKKNDALALKTILSGLSSPIKESMEQCTSAKDLWLKLEETYQSKEEDDEEHSIFIPSIYPHFWSLGKAPLGKGCTLPHGKKGLKAQGEMYLENVKSQI
jgi:hypothetical protein